MAYPILAAGNTWFAPTNTSVKRVNFTEVEIMDSYTPDASVTVTASWDASAAKDGSITCYAIGTKLIMAGNGSGKIFANEDASYMFSGDASISWDRFQNAISISGLSHLDTSSVRSMNSMFACCFELQSLDVSSFNTSNVTDMYQMFQSCRTLKELDVSNFNTSNVTNMKKMFFGVNKITSLNLSNFNTSKVTDMASMFAHCELLKTLHINNFDMSNVTRAYWMFLDCWELETIDINRFYMPNNEDFESMFGQCKKLKKVNLSELNPVSATLMKTMFTGCVSLADLDTSKWNPSSCTDMSFMFYGCSSLKEIDVSNWDVSKVTNFDHFAAHANLKRKGIENWKTTSATNMNALFHNCAEEELDLSGWDVSKVQFFCQMFENSPNLKRIKGLEKWNTSSGLGFDEMFERCYKLEEVDLSAFNTSKAKNGTSASTNGHTTNTLMNMFKDCNNLKKVTLGTNFSINGDGTNTTAANKLILPTPSASYITGADGNWYVLNGDSYAPNAVKDKTPETYYASFDIVADLDVIVKNGYLIEIARAIREENGTSNRYTIDKMDEAIKDLT